MPDGETPGRWNGIMGCDAGDDARTVGTPAGESKSPRCRDEPSPSRERADGDRRPTLGGGVRPVGEAHDAVRDSGDDVPAMCWARAASLPIKAGPGELGLESREEICVPGMGNIGLLADAD